MKKIFLSIFTVVLTMLYSCQSSEIYNELPSSIESFISEYWPNPDIESFSVTADGGYTVTVKNAITASFDKDYSWTDINGDGMPLPQMFLSDQIPDKLYEYLESVSALNEVFRVSRSATTYDVTLLNSALEYNKSTGEITGSSERP